MPLTPPGGFLPYSGHWFDAAEAEAAVRALESGRISQGPAAEEFEARAASYCGARHAVAVSSGTAALHLAFLALDLQPGDEVIVPAWTFVATANAVLLGGGKPVVADIDPLDLNLCAKSVEARLTSRTRAICAVHFAGAPADLPALARLPSPAGPVSAGVAIVEDAAQALGARALDPQAGWHRIGRAVRSRAVCFSLHPSKTITTGEGGLVLTEDPALERRVRELRNHGLVPAPDAPARHPAAGARLERLGLNYRLGEVAAAMGSAQLGKIERFLARRAEIAARYREGLGGLPGLRLPSARAGCEPSHNLFVVRVEGGEAARDRVLRALNDRGIGAAFHYAPLTRHPYYRKRLGWRPEDCPNAEACAAEAMTLPLFPRMSDSDTDRVMEELHGAMASR